MDSFFTVFLDKFKKACHESKPDTIRVGGRYFAFILKEVISTHPVLLKSINQKYWLGIGGKEPKPDDLILITEKEFTSSTKTTKTKKRRSDIYCLEKVSGKELFVEIKWKDEPLDGQIEDYLALTKINPDKAYFSFLTLYDIFTDKKGENDQKVKGAIDEVGENAKYVLLSDLLKGCRTLEANLLRNGQDTGLLKLFISFLEDNTMYYSQEINRQALLALLKNCYGMPNRDGGGKLRTQVNIQNIPEVLKCLLGNLETLGERFHANFNHTDAYGTRPLANFFVYSKLPSIREFKSKIETYITKKGYCDDDSLWLGTWADLEAKDGEFYFENQVTIKNTGTTRKYISFGFYFNTYKPKNDPPISFYAYAKRTNADETRNDMSRHLKVTKDDPSILTLPEEDKLYRAILSIMKQQVEQWLNDEETHNDKKLKESCNALSKALKEYLLD